MSLRDLYHRWRWLGNALLFVFIVANCGLLYYTGAVAFDLITAPPPWPEIAAGAFETFRDGNMWMFWLAVVGAPYGAAIHFVRAKRRYRARVTA